MCLKNIGYLFCFLAKLTAQHLHIHYTRHTRLTLTIVSLLTLTFTHSIFCSLTNHSTHSLSSPTFLTPRAPFHLSLTNWHSVLHSTQFLTLFPHSQNPIFIVSHTTQKHNNPHSPLNNQKTSVSTALNPPTEKLIPPPQPFPPFRHRLSTLPPPLQPLNRRIHLPSPLSTNPSYPSTDPSTISTTANSNLHNLHQTTGSPSCSSLRPNFHHHHPNDPRPRSTTTAGSSPHNNCFLTLTQPQISTAIHEQHHRTIPCLSSP